MNGDKSTQSHEDVIDRIIDISVRSASASSISIFEVSNLGNLIGKVAAEKIRKEFVKFNTPIRQITNLRKFKSWTSNLELTQNVTAKYVPPEVYEIRNEIIIFDNTVAAYRLEPDVFYMEVTDESFAKSMRQMFRSIWNIGDNLLMSADGSTQTKQYLPISYKFSNIPVVVYPAKDDGYLERAFSRIDHNSIQKYVSSVIKSDMGFCKDADMIIAYVWNQEDVPYCDLWRINRNEISDDSGFLYDARIYKGLEVITDMGVASGNSSIVLTAEEMLLRELIIGKGLSFEDASNRERYRARFPVGFVPAEGFYEKA